MDIDSISRAFNLGADEYLNKQVDLIELLLKIKVHLQANQRDTSPSMRDT
jgi:DNA-binding response OmpR family regulator